MKLSTKQIELINTIRTKVNWIEYDSHEFIDCKASKARLSREMIDDLRKIIYPFMLCSTRLKVQGTLDQLEQTDKIIYWKIIERPYGTGEFHIIPIGTRLFIETLEEFENFILKFWSKEIHESMGFLALKDIHSVLVGKKLISNYKFEHYLSMLRFSKGYSLRLFVLNNTLINPVKIKGVEFSLLKVPESKYSQQCILDTIDHVRNSEQKNNPDLSCDANFLDGLITFKEFN